MVGATHRLPHFLVKPFPCQCSVLLKSNGHLTSLIRFLGNLLPLASRLFNGTFVRTLGLLCIKGIILGYALHVRIIAVISTQLGTTSLIGNFLL